MGTFAVMGATGTIGSRLSSRLVQLGHRVLLIGRDAEKLGTLAEQLGKDSWPCHLPDFTSSDALRIAVEHHLPQLNQAAAGESVGVPLHGVVNCIGSLILKPGHGTSDEEFRGTLEANLFTAFAAVRLAGVLLRKTGGSVVLVASAAAEIGLQNHEAISAAKAGIIGLARSAAATYAANNIRVNVVSPGLTCTELTRRIWENPTNSAASSEMHALGRLGQPDHIVSAIAWLLDPLNDWTTGEVMHVDGGLSHLVPRRRV